MAARAAVADLRASRRRDLGPARPSRRHARRPTSGVRRCSRWWPLAIAVDVATIAAALRRGVLRRDGRDALRHLGAVDPSAGGGPAAAVPGERTPVRRSELTANQFVGPPLGGFLVTVGAALSLATIVGRVVRGGRAPAAPDAVPSGPGTTGRRRSAPTSARACASCARHRVLRAMALLTGLANLGLQRGCSRSSCCTPSAPTRRWG